MPTRTVVCWSCGKDSATALWKLQQDPRYAIVGLLTTLTEEYDRVSMSGVRQELLERQAAALGLPVLEVWIPPQCVNPVYEARMGEAIDQLESEGVEAVAFGDLFLQDVREYRERQMASTGLSCVFPIWGEDTASLSLWMIESGLRATLVCVDPKQVPGALAGRAYDKTLLAELPPTADPCGERGEFHTFVWDAPNFTAPIDVRAGDVVEREGFWFADLVPVSRADGRASRENAPKVRR